jgi:hypothetical protein
MAEGKLFIKKTGAGFSFKKETSDVSNLAQTGATDRLKLVGTGAPSLPPGRAPQDTH